jgi:tetratricopeptide (TPR) repeat protein
LDRLFIAYSAGDHDVVRRTIVRAEDIGVDRAAFTQMIRRWSSDWRPVRASFLLELAVAASDAGVVFLANIKDTATLTQYDIVLASLAFVTGRPIPFGSNPRDDQYELLWHKTMLGLLQRQGSSRSFLQDTYLDALEKRFKKRLPAVVGLSVEPRFLLARGIARVQECCTRATLARAQTTPARPTPSFKRISPAALPGRPTWQSALDEAVALFNYAARYPATEVEARTRGSLLLWERGRPAEALQWLNSSPDDTQDRELAYWRLILRGRLLDALKRPAEAASAYREALVLFPESQTAATGLAVSMMREGHHSEAVALAHRARRIPVEVDDPWWRFDFADSRFVSAWLAELRGSNQ